MESRPWQNRLRYVGAPRVAVRGSVRGQAGELPQWPECSRSIGHGAIRGVPYQRRNAIPDQISSTTPNGHAPDRNP